jgi:hypothetical protein
VRPHRALARTGRSPAQGARPQDAGRDLRRTHQGAAIGQRAPAARHYRVRHDKIDATGTVTLRYKSRLYHVGIGMAHKGQRVLVLVADRDVRVLTVAGEILRHLQLDPSRDYQPLG